MGVLFTFCFRVPLSHVRPCPTHRTPLVSSPVVVVCLIPNRASFRLGDAPPTQREIFLMEQLKQAEESRKRAEESRKRAEESTKRAEESAKRAEESAKHSERLLEQERRSKAPVAAGRKDNHLPSFPVVSDLGFVQLLHCRLRPPLWPT